MKNIYQRRPLRLRLRLRLRLFLRPVCAAICMFGAATAIALPQGAQPSFGQTQVQQTGAGKLLIQQSTDKAGINWQSFSIGAGEKVTIQQPNSQSLLLNRVLGLDPSQILGQLQSNGRVFLTNPNGIVFGQGSRVDVGSLVATTLNLSDAAAQAGRYQLTSNALAAPGAIDSQGVINAPGGTVALVAPVLTQGGTINAARVGLAAVSSVSVDVEGDGLIFFNARNDADLATKLNQLGTVNADGGTAELRAVARAGFADTVLNLDGVVRARSIGTREGRIVIDGGSVGVTRVGGEVDASGAAAGERGGDVSLEGQRILVDRGARIDASGDAGGGRVRVGGGFHGEDISIRNADMVIVQPGATLSANAGTAGDGGQVVVWSQSATGFYGGASAKGGSTSGDGGQVEVSSLGQLDFRGSADESAPRGRMGSLLLDPNLITIDDGVTANIDGVGGGDLAAPNSGATPAIAFGDFSGKNSVISSTELGNQLDAGNVTLQAKTNLTVVTPVTASTGTNNLTLQAGGNLSVNATAGITVFGALTLSSNDPGATPAVHTGAVTVLAALSAASISITNNTGGTGTHQLGADLTATTGALDITGNANLTASQTWSNATVSTVSGVVSGASGKNLTKAGIGLLTLTNANTYLGTTAINGGTLAVDATTNVASVGNGTGKITIGGAGTLDVSNGASVANAIDSNGGNVSNDAGLGTVSGVLRLTGAGTQLSSNATGGLSFSSAVTDSGTQGLTVAGNGPVTLAAGGSYNGATTINSGATLQLGDHSTTGPAIASSAVTDNGTLRINLKSGASTALVGGLVNSLTGTGNLEQAGAGSTLQIGAALAYGGATLISAGTLTTGGNNRLPTSTALTVDGTLQLGGNQTVASLAGASSGTIPLATHALTVNGTASTVFAGVISGDPLPAGTTQLTKTGSGTLTLSGTNTYTGDTVIGVGAALQLGNNTASGSIVNSTVTNSGTLKINRTDLNNLVGDLTAGVDAASTGGLEQVGTGTTVIDTDLAYSGATVIDANGTLQLGNNSAAGSIAQSAVTDNGTLVISRSDVADLKLVGDLTNAFTGSVGGKLTQAGSGTTVIDTALSYGGGTAITGGTLAIDGATAVAGSGKITVSGAKTLDLRNGTTVGNAIDSNGGSISNSIGALATINGTLTLTANGTKLSAAGAGLEVANPVAENPGPFNLTATSGTVILDRGGDYTGATTIDLGATLQIGADHPIGSISGSDVTDNGTLKVMRSDGAGVTLVGDITKSFTGSAGGVLNQAGSGVLIIDKALSYGGGTTISGDVGSTLVIDATTVPLAAAGSGKITVNGRTLDLRHGAQVGNQIEVTGGTLSSSVGGGSLTGGTLTGGVTLKADSTLNSADTSSGLTIDSVISQTVGPFSLNKTGSGLVTFKQANSYGATTISDGTLRLDNAGTVGSSAIGNVASTAVLDLVNGAGATVAVNFTNGTVSSSTGNGHLDGLLTMTSGAKLSATGASVLTLNGGIAESGAAALTKQGTGTVRLTQASIFTGGTTVADGTLELGGTTSTLGTSGDIALTLSTSTLSLTRTDTALNLANNITLLGNVAKSGVGTVKLSGTNSYGGATTISGGTLTAASASAIPSTSDVTLSGGGVLRLESNDTIGSLAGVAGTRVDFTGTARLTTGGHNNASTEFAGILQDATGADHGRLTKSGSGTFILSGNNSYTGGTTINANGGTLQIGKGGATGAIVGNVAIGSGATLSLNRNNTTPLTLAGDLSGAGTLSQDGVDGRTLLTGTNSGLSGPTAVNQGTLVITTTASSPSASAVVVGSSGVLEVQSTAVIGSLADDGSAGGGAVNLIGAVTLSAGVDNSTTRFSGAVHGATGSLTKQGSGTLTLTGANDYGGTLTIAGGTLEIGEGGSTGGANIVDSAILKINRSSTPLDLGLVVSGSGDLVQAGAATLTLSAGNTYQGATTINAGQTLQVTGAGTTGDGTGAVGIGNGATLDIANGATVASAVTSNAGTLSSSGGGGTLGGVLTLAGNTTINVAPLGGQLTLNQSIAQTGPARQLTKTGAGKLVSSVANNFSGGTLLNAGTIELGGATATLGSGPISVANAATLALSSVPTVANALNLASGATVSNLAGTTTVSNSVNLTSASGTANLSAAGTLQFGGVISGAAGVVTNGGLVRFTNGNTYAGATQVGTGTLQLSGSGTAGSALGGITVASGATLDLVGGAAVGDTVSLTNATLRSSSGGGTVSGVVTLNTSSSVQVDNAPDTLTLGNVVGGAGGLTKSGLGTLALGGANQYLGSTAVSSGTVVYGATASRTSAGGTTLASGTILDIQANTFADNVTSNGGTIQNSAVGTTGILAGTLSLSGVTTLAVADTNSTLRLTGNISGAGNVIKTGAGRIDQTIGAVSSTGTTDIQAGTYQVEGSTGSTGVGPGAVTVRNGATLSVSGGATIVNPIVLDGGTLGNLLLLGGAGTISAASAPISLSADSMLSSSLAGAANALTVNSAITGGFGLTKTGAGTVVLTNSGNNYSGAIGGVGTVGTSVSAGTLSVSGTGTVGLSTRDIALAAGSTLDIANGAVVANKVVSNGGTVGNSALGGRLDGTLTMNADTTLDSVGSVGSGLTIGNVISGSANLTKTGTGPVILAAANTYTGTTTISAGLLEVDNLSAFPAANSFVDHGALRFNLGADQIVAQNITDNGAVGGAGAVFQSGAGMVTLTSANTYSGGTTIDFGSTLKIIGTGGIGNGAVVDNGTLAVDNSSGTAVILGNLAGGFSGTGTLQLLGTGETVIRGNSSLAAGVTVAQGKLSIEDGTFSSAIDVGDGAVLDIRSTGATPGVVSSTINVAGGATGGTIANSIGIGHTTGLVKLNGGPATLNAQGTLTLDKVDGATVALNKTGAGTVVLMGSGTNLTTNSPLTISQGTLSLSGAGGTLTTQPIDVNVGVTLDLSNGAVLSNPVNLAGGTLAAGATAGQLAGQLRLTAGGSAVSAVSSLPGEGLTLGDIVEVGGARALTKNGLGTVIFTGNASYNGGTTIALGTLQIGNGGSGGNLPFSGGVVDHGTLAFNLTGLLDVTIPINGSGNLVQMGSGDLRLDVANGYAGTTTVSNGGRLIVNVQDAIPATSDVTVNAGSQLVLSASDTIGSLSGAGSVDTQFSTLTTGGHASSQFDGNLFGSGNLVKEGVGTTFTLNGNNSYFGQTTINGGVLEVGNGGINGTLGIGPVVDNATLRFNRGDGFYFGNPISGSGGLEQVGGGTTLLGTSNTYAGTTLISGGALWVGAPDAIPSTSAVTISNNANLTLFSSDTIGSLAGASGTVVLQIGTQLITGSAGSTVFSGAISGGGVLTKVGSSTFTLDGNNTYSGATFVEGGVLEIGSGGTTGTLGLASGLVFVDSTLRFNRSDAGLTVANTLLGIGGIEQVGTGTTTLTAANSYTGPTLISNGTLVAANSSGAVPKDSAVTVAAAGTFNVAANDRVGSLDGSGNVNVGSGVIFDVGALGTDTAFNGTFNGASGVLRKSGTGTLTLTGANGLGSTDIVQGRLRVSGAAPALGNGFVAVGSGATLDLTNGAVVGVPVFLNGGTIDNTAAGGSVSAAVTLGGDSVLSSNGGSGLTLGQPIVGGFAISKNGVGQVTIATANSYGGATHVNFGTLITAGADSIPDTSAVTVADHATLQLGGSDTIGALAGGSIGGGAVVTLGGGTLNTGGSNATTSFAGALSNGSLIKSGNGTFTLLGASTLAGVSIASNGGRLRVDGPAAALGGNGVNVANGAVLDLADGASIADTVTLNGGTLDNSSNSGTLTGPVVLTANSNLSSGAGAGLTLTQPISGGFGIDKLGVGSVTIAGGNTYTGATQIHAGTLATSAADAIPDGSDVSLFGGVLRFGGNDTVASLNSVFTGDLIDLGGFTVTTGSAASTSIAGAIDGGATGRLVKVGTGTLTLGGPGGYGGGTAIVGGTLQLDGAGASLGSGAVTVASTTTLDLRNSAHIVNPVTLSGKLDNTGGSGVIGGPVTLAADSILSSTATGTGLTLSQPIDGAFAIDKAGTGQVTIAAGNTYGGATHISFGTLITSGADSIPDGSAVTVADHATLQLGGSDTIGSLAGGTVGGGAVVSLGGGTLNIGGNNATTTFAGALGNGSLVKSGSGVFTLQGTNTYGGGTSVQAGTVQLDGPTAALGSGAVGVAAGATLDLVNGAQAGNPVTSNGGTLANSAGLGQLGGAIAIGSASTTFSVGGGGLNLTSAITGGPTGGIAKTGAGPLTLAAGNAYGGATFINAGTLNTNPAGSIPDLSAVTVADGATLHLGGNETIGSLAGGSVGGGATVNLNLATLTTGGDNTDTSYAGVLTSGALTKVGSGTFSVLGNSNLNGSININQGRLRVDGSTAALSNGTITVSGVAVLDLSNGATISTAVNANGGGIGNSAGAGTLSGALILGADTVLSSNASGAGSGLTLTQPISGNFSIDKSGSGLVTIAASNSYGGSTRVHAGVLATSAADSIPDASAVSVDDGTTLRFGGSDTIGSLTGGATGAGTVINLGSFAIDTGNNNGSTTVRGTIIGSGSIVKSGTGTMTLAGANTYGGGTSIHAGTVQLDGAVAAMGSGAVSVASGAMLDLVNGAQANNPITSSNGSTLANSVGFGHLGGAITLGGSTTFTVAGSGLSLAGAISGGATDGIVKSGAGPLTLATGNTWGGATLVNAGTLITDPSGSIPDTSAVTVADHAGLRLGGNETIGSLAGGSFGGGSTVDLGGATLTTGASNANTIYAGVISNGALTKVGSGTFTVQGANTLAGNVAIDVGALRVDGGGSTLGTGGVTIANGAMLDLSNGAVLFNNVTGNGGTLGNSAGAGTLNGTYTLAANSGLSSSAAGVGAGLTITKPISGGFTLAKTGSGTVTIAAGNSYTGATHVVTGTLVTAAADAIPDGSAVIVDDHATLRFGGRDTVGSLAGGATGAGTVIDLGSFQITAGGDNSNTTVRGGALVGATGSLAKVGSGTLTLTGANTFGGGTVVGGGALVVDASTAVAGSGRIDVTQPGALLDIVNGADVANAVNLAFGTVGNSVGTGRLSGPLTLTGSSNLSSSSTSPPTGGLTIVLAIADSAGNSSVTKQGVGTVTWLSPAQYGGVTTIAAGTLVTSGSQQVPDTSAVNVAAGATLKVGGNETIGSLSGAGTVDLGVGANRLTAGGDNTSTLFSGLITGAGSLSKAGAGVLSLNTTSGYAGGTAVDAGTLRLDGAAAVPGTGALTVASGATLDLSNGAALGGILTLAGGTLANSTGAATLNAATTLSGNSRIVVDGAGLTVDAVIGESGGHQALNKAGGGTVTLGAGGGLANSGATTIEAGVLTTTQAEQIGNASALTVASGAKLQLGGDETIGSLAGGGLITLGGHSLTMGGDNTSTLFAGAIDGTGGVAKQGSGTTTLSGTNLYTGTTAVAQGTLALLGGDNLADASAVTVAAGATLAMDPSTAPTHGDSVATLDLAGHLTGAGKLTAATYTVHGGAVVDAPLGAGTLVASAGTPRLNASADAVTVRVDGGNLSLGAPNLLADAAAVTVAHTATLTLGGDDRVGSLDLSGTLAGSGTLTAATYALNSATVLANLGIGSLTSIGASTLSGSAAVTALSVDGGSLNLAAANRLGSGAVVNIASGASLVTAADQLFGGLKGAGDVALSGAAVLSTDGVAATSFDGKISGNGALHKVGTGTLVLTGANNYSGLTTIDSGGTLQVGAGGATGNLGVADVVDNGTLRFNRSDNLDLPGTVSGSGGIEQAGSGILTLRNPANSFIGATLVSAGQIATDGSQRIPDASAVTVEAGARLTLGGAETVASINAKGNVTLGGSVTTPVGDQIYLGAVTAPAQAITLTARSIDARDSGNQWGTQPLSIDATTVQLSSGKSDPTTWRDLNLGLVKVTGGGHIDAGKLALTDALTLSGTGTLELSANAAPTYPSLYSDPVDLTHRQVPGGLLLALASDVVTQTAAGRISVGDGATLTVLAPSGGSVNLTNPANDLHGGISVLSGPDWNTAWKENSVTVTGQALPGSGQSLIQLVSGDKTTAGAIHVSGKGIEGDLVYVQSSKLDTAVGSAIVARLPYNDDLGTSLQHAALAIELLPQAFEVAGSFGSNLQGSWIQVAVGSLTTGNRSSGINAGFVQSLPKLGAKGATTIYLAGPAVALGGGYRFFHDGATEITEIPVAYNGVLPQSPQVAGSLSAVVAVTEGARKDRFEESVRTENVATRLKAGVVAEVGPSRPATVGSEGARGVDACLPVDGGLECKSSGQSSGK